MIVFYTLCSDDKIIIVWSVTARKEMGYMPFSPEICKYYCTNLIIDYG